MQMSRAVSQCCLLRRHLHRFTSSSHSRSPMLRDPFPKPITSSSSSSHYSNGSFSRYYPSLPSARLLPNTIPKHGAAPPFFRFFSSSNPGGRVKSVNTDFAKKLFDKPAAFVTSALSRYGGAMRLQIEAFFKRNYLFLLGGAGIVICGVLWRIMFWIANAFVGISEGMAKYGFLALSSAIVAFAVSSFGSTLFL